MKSFVSLKFQFFFFALTFSLISHAASVRVDVGDLRYIVDTETQTAEVYGKVSTSSIIATLVIPDYIEYEGSLFPVNSI